MHIYTVLFNISSVYSDSVAKYGDPYSEFVLCI